MRTNCSVCQKDLPRRACQAVTAQLQSERDSTEGPPLSRAVASEQALRIQPGKDAASTDSVMLLCTIHAHHDDQADGDQRQEAHSPQGPAQ